VAGVLQVMRNKLCTLALFFLESASGLGKKY
jgi:hypothetical protein